MKIFFVAILLALAPTLQAQTDVDPRLTAKFGEAHLAELEKNHPAIIAYWTFFLDHSYTITDMVPGKDLGEIPVVQIEDLSQFNILALDVHPIESGNRLYRIEGTDKMLVMHSSEKIAELFNAHRQAGN